MTTGTVHPQYMTDGLKSIMLKGIKVGSFLRVHPFYWSDAEQRLKIRRGGPDLIFHKFMIANITLEFCFVAARAAQAVYKENVRAETQIICVFFAVYQLYAVVLAYCVILSRENVPELLNSGFRLLASFDVRLPVAQLHPKFGIPIVWMTEHLERLLFYSVNLITLTTCSICFLRPDYPVLVSSLCRPDSEYYVISIAVSIAIQLCFQLFYMPQSFILIFIGAGVGVPLIPAIKNLASKRMNTAEDIKENLRDYKYIRLFLGQFQEVYLRFIVPVSQYILIALSTFSIVGVIRLKGSERSMLMTVGVLAYGFFMLSFGAMASISCCGKEVLSRWRQNYVIDPRHIRCLQPIRMNLSFYAVIDKGILLTSTDIIVNSAIKMHLI